MIKFGNEYLKILYEKIKNFISHNNKLEFVLCFDLFEDTYAPPRSLSYNNNKEEYDKIFDKNKLLLFTNIFDSKYAYKLAKLLQYYKYKYVNEKSSNGWTSLMSAVDLEYEEIVKLLISRTDTDINMQNKGGWTALMIGAEKGYDKIVGLLLLCLDIKINLKNNDGWTALMIAANKGYDKIVELLLDQPNIDLTVSSKTGLTAYSTAVNENHLHIAELILQKLNYQSSSEHVDNTIYLDNDNISGLISKNSVGGEKKYTKYHNKNKK